MTLGVRQAPGLEVLSLGSSPHRVDVGCKIPMVSLVVPCVVTLAILKPMVVLP